MTAHILVVEARFYEDLADELARGALRALEAAGATWDRVAVPGAFEIPAAIGFAARAAREAAPDASGGGSGPRHDGPRYDGPRYDGPRYDGYVALGVVIRGETTHYDYVCIESARGLQDLALRDGLAIGYGILTVENGDQAWARARVAEKDKGGAAARACLAMVELKRQFSVRPR